MGWKKNVTREEQNTHTHTHQKKKKKKKSKNKPQTKAQTSVHLIIKYIGEEYYSDMDS